MENHPIPQDVTGFKFKLIGSMTVKQFLYLLGFGILSMIFLIFHMNLFIKVPIMTVLGCIGIFLAFIPIEGRPADIMIMNFAKAIPSENRYIFKKRGVNLANYEAFKIIVKKPVPASAAPGTQPSTPKSVSDDKRAILISRLRNSSFRPDDSEIKQLNNIKAIFDTDSSATPQTQIFVSEQKNKPMVAIHADEPKVEITNAVSAAAPIILSSPVPQVAVHEIKPPEEKKADMPAENPSLQAAKPAASEQPAQQEAPRQEIPQPQIKLSDNEEKTHSTPPPVAIGQVSAPNLAGGFPTLPDVGNVVLGMVRDARGRTLPNILVEVVDDNNIPVRAFKTNALGQFASATPLPDGVYKIHFEDPQKNQEFEIVDINLSGEIFQPIEAVSVDAREKLRRELFGTQPAAPSSVV